MSDRPPAFALSLVLHGGAAALLLFFGYTASRQKKEVPKIFELVAGAGDNYLATEAPALGVPGGIKLDIPAPPKPEPKSEPIPEPPVAPEPSPITPAPIEKPAPPPPKPADKPVPSDIPNFKNQIVKKVIRADSQAKREIKKEREKEAKTSKADFDKKNKPKATAAANAPKRGPAKVAKIDTEGIREGVIGGSTKNTKGGAGGKALVAEDGSAMERYFALLKSRLKENHEKPSGLSDTLVARIEFFVGADGTISRVRISRSSGSEEFDRTVREAFARTKSIGARPDKKGELVELEFRMREDDSL